MLHTVRGKLPNTWGIYDMQGNVWEWCQDLYDSEYYANSPSDDPPGPRVGAGRVIRGGMWVGPAEYCRSAFRIRQMPGDRTGLLGFRVSLVLSDTAGEHDAANPDGSTANEPSPASSLIGPDGKWNLPPGAPPPAVAPFDPKKAKEHQEGWAKQLGAAVELSNSIGMKLALVPPGEFEMGSPQELIDEALKAPDIEEWVKPYLSAEGPRHHVRITRPFYLGVYEVTQEEFQRVMGSNPSAFCATGSRSDKVADQDTKPFPVESVTWNQAVEFCQRLSNRPEERAARRWYRLPSEAQWEYACRAGNPGRHSFSSTGGKISGEDEQRALLAYAWVADNSGGRTHAVGGKRANAWGLYDMDGNVSEWCHDGWYKDYFASSPVDDPPGPPLGWYATYTLRGGAWTFSAKHCRTAGRGGFYPAGRGGDSLGFRVSLVAWADTPPPAKPPSR
jgi:formylglycine-generating enzyme required for sulfatase activity